MIKRLLGQIVFIAGSGAIIVLAGGGVTFLRRPVGVVYLVLWAVWFLATALGRQWGGPSSYDQKQRLFITIAVAVFTVPVLVVAPPWEYAHFTGPIPRDGPLAWVGLVIFAGGIVLYSAAMWALRGSYRVRLGVEAGQRLVTSGPYRLVRHPGYLSYIVSLMGIGLALSSLSALGLTVLVTLFLLWRIKHEEEMLVAEFGKEYKVYMQRTKWRLIPLAY